MNAPDKRGLFIQQLIDLDEDSVLALLKQRVETNDNVLEILEDAQEGLRLAGERYQKGEYYVSGLMMAGEIFREITEVIRPMLIQSIQASASGHVLLGTIQGDIHDMGKNILGTFLESNGFTVTDLGVDVPAEVFLEKAQQLKPDIIAISGLLTTSYDYMKATVQLLRKSTDPQIASIPIIVGGGTMNAKVCGIIGADYWAIDAQVGTELCKQILAEQGA